MCFLARFDLGSNSTLAKNKFSLFKSLFQVKYNMAIAVFFNKNEGNNRKVEYKVLGRERGGAGMALLSQ